LIVSRYADRAEAVTLASRVLTAVGNPGTSVESVGFEIRVTCSVGWAAYPWYPDKPHDAPYEAVLALADRGVYEAKTTGKNRAIGVSPSDSGKTLPIATGDNRPSAYSVQLICVEGPTPGLNIGRGFVQASEETQMFNLKPVDCCSP
jgi:hypothetical protein